MVLCATLSSRKLINIISAFSPSGFSIDQKPVGMESYSGSLTKPKTMDILLSEHFDVCPPSLVMQLPNTSLHQDPAPQQRDRQTTADEEDAFDCGKPHKCVSPCNTFMGKLSINQSFYPDLILPRQWNDF